MRKCWGEGGIDDNGRVLERPLVGVMDLVTADADGKRCIVELKTAGRRYDEYWTY